MTLRSKPFTCNQFPFVFDHLEEFAKSIRGIYDSLSGTARLGHTYEHDYIAFRMDFRGRLEVSGVLTRHLPRFQELTFGFEVDQTYLPPLISLVEQVLEALPQATRNG